MPIRYVRRTFTDPIDATREKIRELNTQSNIAMREAVEENKPFALEELQAEPGKPKYPIEWTSEKQRRYVMGYVLERDENGEIIPYQRTGDLARGWELRYIRTPEGGAFIFRNETPYVRFVGGSLARSLDSATRFKQQFHSNTGWQTYKLTVDFWSDSITETYNDKMADWWIGDARASTTTRAVTPRLAR